MVKGGGWRFFAATMLGLAGVMRFFDVIWTFSSHGPLGTTSLDGAVFGHSLKVYGWIYLIVAVILIASSVAVVAGSEMGRWVGIIAAALLAISAIWWMPFYPVWSLTYIAIGMLVIYGLAMYGGHEAYEATEAARLEAHPGYGPQYR
ncbi:DUF7144 family membrane protein [Jatrophihabitans sp. DSM 45814]